ncbi:hypothetical protein [Aquimarina sp. RZ0]|nr:hypothetical protein [Aquimarina sp. RZ0]
MKPSGGFNSSLKKRSLYFFIGFFIIAILSMAIVVWKLGIID